MKQQQQERIKGYVAGRRSVDGVSTWAVWVNQPGHPLDGKKLVVHSIGADVYSLGKGDNVTFELLRQEPGPDSQEGGRVWEGNNVIMAAHVFRDAGRTLNWFERIVFNTHGEGVDNEFFVIGSVLLVICATIFLFCYYTMPVSWYRYSIVPFQQMAGVMVGWFCAALIVPMMNLALFRAIVYRLQQMLDYSQRSEYTSVRWEFGFNAVLCIGFAVLFYYGNGAFNGFADWTGWFMTVVVKYFITFLLAFPVVATAFLALTASWAVRDKSKLMFATN